MSGFVASTSTSLAASGSYGLGIKAVTYQIRVSRVEINTGVIASGGATLTVQVYKYTGATITGGSTVTCTPFRNATPTASVKAGASISGTSAILHQESAGISAGTGVGAIITYQFPFDLIINAGDAVWILGSANSTAATFTYIPQIDFEELHLARSS